MEAAPTTTKQSLANQPDEILLLTYNKMSIPDLLKLRNVSKKFEDQITPEVMIESAFNTSISTIEEAVTISKVILACPRRKQRQALIKLADNLPHKSWAISLLDKTAGEYLEACSEDKVPLNADDPKRSVAFLRKLNDRSERYGDDNKNRERIQLTEPDKVQYDENAFRINEIKGDLVNQEEYCWAQGHQHSSSEH